MNPDIEIKYRYSVFLFCSHGPVPHRYVNCNVSEETGCGRKMDVDHLSYHETECQWVVASCAGFKQNFSAIR